METQLDRIEKMLNELVKVSRKERIDKIKERFGCFACECGPGVAEALNRRDAEEKQLIADVNNGIV